MIRFIQIAIVVIGLGLGVFMFAFDDHLTTRDIEKADNVYSVPYETHGGTVYISAKEQWIRYVNYALSGVLVLTQLAINRAGQRKRKTT